MTERQFPKYSFSMLGHHYNMVMVDSIWNWWNTSLAVWIYCSVYPHNTL